MNNGGKILKKPFNSGCDSCGEIMEIKRPFGGIVNGKWLCLVRNHNLTAVIQAKCEHDFITLNHAEPFCVKCGFPNEVS